MLTSLCHLCHQVGLFFKMMTSKQKAAETVNCILKLNLNTCDMHNEEKGS